MSRPAVTVNEMAFDVKNAITNACAMSGERGSVMLHCTEEQADAFVDKHGGVRGVSPDGRKYILWRGFIIYLVPYEVPK